MALPRFLNLVDIGVIAVVAVAIFLPSREMYASNAIKGDAPEQFAVALAEARMMARPDDGVAVEELTKKLGAANLKDWAVELSVAASTKAKDSPTRWRMLYAASVAYLEKLDVKPALDYAKRAIAACEVSRERDANACPAPEEVRLHFYHQHLEAGVRSGIDPRVDAAGFRKAGESGVLNIYIGGRRDPEPKPEPKPQPTEPAGSGSSGSASP